MKIILTETIETLGIIGGEVTVADGYARNYLLPQKKAVAATRANRRKLEQEKEKFEVQIAKEEKMANEMAERLQGVSCTISARVSDESNLYGSVKVREIMDALAKENVTVEKRMVLLKEPIKQLGTFNVPIRVYKGIEPEIIVNIVPEEKE